MGFTLVMMALWPEVQEKIFAEVSKALPADADEPTSYDEVMAKLASRFLRLHQLLPTDIDSYAIALYESFCQGGFEVVAFCVSLAT